jgi:hypothetical protein
VDPGTIVVTGRTAFHLLRQDYNVASDTEPANWGYLVGIGRQFYLAIRNADAIQTVTLGA